MMTKFFVQLLLSVIVGISAAMSFTPKVQTNLHKNLVQASTSLQETASVAIENANKVTAKISTAVSIKANTEISPESKEKVDLKLKNNMNAKINNGESSLDNLLPDVSANNSFINEFQTNVEADTAVLDVELKDKSKSALGLDLGVGK